MKKEKSLEEMTAEMLSEKVDNEVKEYIGDVNEESPVQPEVAETEEPKTVSQNIPESVMGNLGKLLEEKTEEVEYLNEKYGDIAPKQELKVDKGNFNDEIIEVSDEKNNTDTSEDKPAKDYSHLSSLKIRKSKNSSKEYERIKRNRKMKDVVTQSVFASSGYSAKFAGFKSSELFDIEVNIGNLDSYSQTKYKYELAYDKLRDSSVDLTFDEFLKCTSYLEHNNIFYALFCSTNPDVNEYPIDCPICEHHFTKEIPNSALMYLDDGNRDKTTENIIKVIKDVANAKELLESSEVNTLRRIDISNGTVIDLRHPSLYNALEDTTAHITDSMINKYPATINLMPFIEHVYVQDEDDMFIELEAFEDKFLELAENCDDDDIITIVDEINEIRDTNKINFGFRGLVCPKCHKEIPEQIIPDFAEMLFLMHRIKTNKKSN